MDLPVELVGLLKHAVIDGKQLTWDLQVNSCHISVKLMWIKADKPVEKKGQVTSQPTLTQIRERSTQTKSNFIGRQLTPTKYLDTVESRTPWNKCTSGADSRPPP